MHMHDLITRDFSTDQTRFGIDTMIQEWHDFLLTQCGYTEPDHELVARLAARNAQALSEVLMDEARMVWSPLHGTFTITVGEFTRNGFDFPLNREQLDLIWSDAFSHISEDYFEQIEGGLYDERQHGIPC